MRRDFASSVAYQDIRQPPTVRSKVVRLRKDLSNRLTQQGAELIIYPAHLQDRLILSQLYASSESTLYELIIIRSNRLTRKHKYPRYRKALTNCRQEIIQTGYLIVESESGTVLILNQLIIMRHPYLKLLDKRPKKLRQNLKQKLTSTNPSWLHPMKENYRKQYNGSNLLLPSAQGNSRRLAPKLYTTRLRR